MARARSKRRDARVSSACVLKEMATMSSPERALGPVEGVTGVEDGVWKVMTPGNTAWLRANPIAANQASRAQETGRGSVRKRLVVCEPAGLEETRRGWGPRANWENSCDRKYTVRWELTTRYKAARRSCGNAVRSAACGVSSGMGGRKVKRDVATPKNVKGLSKFVLTINPRATAVGAVIKVQNITVSIQRGGDGVWNHQRLAGTKYWDSLEAQDPSLTSVLVRRHALAVVGSGLRRNERIASPTVTRGSKVDLPRITAMLITVVRLSNTTTPKIEPLRLTLHVCGALGCARQY